MKRSYRISAPMRPQRARYEKLGKVNEVMAIYEIVARGALQGAGTLRNVLHYDSGATVLTEAQMQLVANVIDGDFKDNLQSIYHPNVFMGGWGIRRVDIPNQPEAILTPAAGTWSGTGTGEQLPEMVAAMVTWRAFTAFPRTSRSYLWPMTENGNSSSGGINEGHITSITQWATDVTTLVVADVGTLTKVAVRFTGDPRAVTAFNQLTSIAVATRWRTQRRRRLGVGA